MSLKLPSTLSLIQIQGREEVTVINFHIWPLNTPLIRNIHQQIYQKWVKILNAKFQDKENEFPGKTVWNLQEQDISIFWEYKAVCSVQLRASIHEKHVNTAAEHENFNS